MKKTKSYTKNLVGMSSIELLMLLGGFLVCSPEASGTDYRKQKDLTKKMNYIFEEINLKSLKTFSITQQNSLFVIEHKWCFHYISIQNILSSNSK
jgi:hypothetical protein